MSAPAPEVHVIPGGCENGADAKIVCRLVAGRPDISTGTLLLKPEAHVQLAEIAREFMERHAR